MADTYTDLTNLRGPAARIVAVDTEALPAGTEPTVEMVGPDQGRMFTFGIPAGMPASAAVPQDTAVGGFIGTAGTASQTKTDERVYRALARTTAPVVTVQDGIDGIVGGTTVDNTAAIQAKIDQAGRGGTVVFTNPGLSRAIRIDSTINIKEDQWGMTFRGIHGDPYSLQLWASQQMTMFNVKAPGAVFDGLSLTSAFDRASTATVGIKFWGTKAADIDAAVTGSTFLGLSKCIEMHGKNLIVTDSTFSNSQTGIYTGAQDVNYHTSFESRNLIARGNRFHGMGATTSHGSIYFSPEVAHSESVVQNNFFDMFGIGNHVVAVGPVGGKHESLFIDGNNHADVQDVAYFFNRVERSKISNAMIRGVGGTSPTGSAVYVLNGNAIDLNGLTILTHANGLRLGSSTHTFIRNSTIASNSGHGMLFDAGNSRVQLNGNAVFGNVLWGMTGSAIANPYASGNAVYSNGAGDINPILGLA